ncbi:MAG: nitroreductase family protein [Tepidisphaeraceae bacterium]
MSETLPSARRADHPIEPLFLKRWSPRAMDGKPLSDAATFSLFEAARWAPSSSNEQEWRFLYARPGSAYWETFLGLLAEGNRVWCKNAGLLCVIIASKYFARNNKPNPVYSFDAGSAFMSIALQGTSMGLVVHGMAGFDYELARSALNVPETFAVEAMFAVGHPGDPAELPEALRSRELPSQRRPITESIAEGPFAF